MRKVDKIEKEEIIYQMTIRGKNVQIADVISYPASGLDKDKIYLVTVSKLKEKIKTVFNPSKRQEKEVK